MHQIIANCETGEILEVELTEKEIEERIADVEKYKAIKEAENLKTIAKAALLERLGITEEEAKLLLG